MQRVLSRGLVLVALFVFLSACESTKNIQLHDPSKVPPSNVARLFVPDYIELVDVDGKEVSGVSDRLARYKFEIQLGPGDHEMTVRYNAFWEYDTSHNFEKLRSKAVVIAFNVGEGRSYGLRHPVLRDIKEAREFADSPKFWVEEMKGNGNESPSGNSERNVSDVPANAKGPASKSSITMSPGKTDDDVLKKDWESMSEAEKKRFKEWMEKQKPQ
jgi:uncharacterized protein YccT (UPF0319 family)